MVYATLIVVLTLLPVFFLEGLAGSFFRPLAGAYVLAILASLAVALTVTPALSLMLLPKASQRRQDAPLTRLLKGGYRQVLPLLMSQPVIVGGLALAGFVAACFSVPMLGEELMPKFKETDFLMHWVEKPGIGIDAMDRITIRASKELRAIDGVRNFGSHIGRAAAADEVVGPNFTELWISIDNNENYDQTVAKIQETVDGYPGLYRDLLTYLTERIKEVITGASGAVVIRIFGPELDELRAKADEVAAAIEDVEGVSNLKVEQQVLVPQVVVRFRPQAAAIFGLTPGDVLTATSTWINGARVGEIYEGQKIFGVVVWGEKFVRRDIDALQNLLIDTPSGAQVPLKDVADIAVEPAPNSIKREGASRRIDVICNASGRDLGGVARDVEKTVLEKVSFDRGYHPEFLGEYAEAQASQQAVVVSVDRLDRRNPVVALCRFPIMEARAVDLPRAAVRLDRRRGRGVCFRRCDFAGFVDRVCDRPGRRSAEWDHADRALPPSPQRRGRALRERTRTPRRGRTIGSDSDDRPHHGACVGAADRQRQSART